jgi:glycosidase
MTSYKEINAESQVGVKDSVFEYWASILRLRKAHRDIFIYGDFDLVDDKNEDVLAYIRTFEGQKVVVVTNFHKIAVSWSLPKGIVLRDDLLISNYGGIKERDGKLSLRPFEAFACFVE